MAIDRDKVLQAAQKLVEKKRYDKAIAELQKIIAEDPNDARTLLKIGDLYVKAEQYAEAIATYERVGIFYGQQGFALKAIAVYKQIREIIHKYAPFLEDRFGHIVPRLAEIYTQLGLVSDALAAYDEVATRLQRAGRDRDAIDIFRRVVDLDPQNPLPYLRLAEAYVRVKDVDNAIQRFGSAAEILLRLGRRDDALKVVERLLQHRQDVRFARMAAEIYLDRGQANDGMAALTKLQVCFKDNPRDLDTLAVLSRAFDMLGQPAKAVEVQKEAARIAREVGKLDVFHGLVDGLLARAPHDEAVRQLAAQRSTAALSAAPAAFGRESIAEISVVEDDVVVVDEEVVEAPFALRQSQPQIPQAAAQPRAAAQPAARPDPAARLRQLLAQADVLRRGRQYGQATMLLEQGIAEQPHARELRERLCDLLIEAGDQEGAIAHMLAFAEVLAAEDDVDGAARILDEVLLLEPDQPQAVQALRALGYAVPASAADQVAIDEYGQPYGEPEEAPPEHAHDYEQAPLPAYDLDDQRSARAEAPPAVALDDPFGGEAPLPSFPIDDEAALHAQQRLERPPLTEPPRSSPTVIGAWRPPSEPPVSAAPASAQLDEDALEEVEFFASHGMFDEARAMLDEQLSRLPNHPLLLERKREIEQLAAGGQPDLQSGTREVPRSEPVAAPVTEDEDRSFDIAASLDALDALDALEHGAPPGGFDNPHEQVSVEAVFEQFKAGVAAQISESDAATHYDLGLAYREMGLLTDAANEFELASRDPTRECVCKSMIGMIHLEIGNIEAAIDAFLLGLHASNRTTDQELALTYEIANAYEMRNQPDQALYYFQRVARIDPGYADPRGGVQERMVRLSPAPKAAPARAVGAELVSDEFDAAFDDLLAGKKLP